MLHDCHDLESIIPQSLYPGKHILTKFRIGSYFSLFLCHADMTFINKQVLLRCKTSIGPAKWLFRNINHRAPGSCLRILHHIIGVQRNPFQLLSIVNNDGTNMLTVFQRVFSWEKKLKNAVFQGSHGMGMSIPTAKVAGKVHSLSTWRPLTVIPPIIRSVKSKVMMSVGVLRQGHIRRQNFFFCGCIVVHTQLKIPCKRLQGRIFFNNTQIHKAATFHKILNELLTVNEELKFQAQGLGCLTA